MAFRLTPSSSLLLHLIRGVTAQAVVVGHALAMFEIQRLPYVQNSGVVIFFILSGFVIPYSALGKVRSTREYSFTRFFIDRLCRIYMGFIPSLIFVVAAEVLTHHLLRLPNPKSIAEPLYGIGTATVISYHHAFSVKAFIGNLLMLQDFPFQPQIYDFFLKTFSLNLSSILPITSFGSARPFWTIAIEWWIYMLFGWIALAHRFRKKHP